MKTHSPVRYAVVGLGHIAQAAILPAFQHAANSELAALITGDDVKGRELSAKYRVPAYGYDEFEDALHRERISAVFIALPNHLHREYTELAARGGVHVLCEKPMAVTEAECQAMIHACEIADVRLMVAYRLHFTEAHLQAIALAHSGQLGDLRSFQSFFSMQAKEDNIRLRRETGGGTLFDIGIYCINAARYLFRSEPEEVLGICGSRPDSRFDEVEEMTTAILRFPGDRIASFTCSFGALDRDQFDLVGTSGAIHMEPAYTYTGELKWTATIGEETHEETFAPGDQFAAELIYFSECIRQRRLPEPSGLEGLIDVRIINAIYQSAHEGRAIQLRPRIQDEAYPDLEQAIQRPPADEPEIVHAEAPHD